MDVFDQLKARAIRTCEVKLQLAEACRHVDNLLRKEDLNVSPTIQDTDLSAPEFLSNCISWQLETPEGEISCWIFVTLSYEIDSLKYHAQWNVQGTPYSQKILNERGCSIIEDFPEGEPTAIEMPVRIKSLLKKHPHLLMKPKAGVAL